MNEKISFLITHFYTLNFFSEMVHEYGQNGFTYYEWINNKFISDLQKKLKKKFVSDIYKEK
jgi:lauroyl/myristoyl acyltransferase